MPAVIKNWDVYKVKEFEIKFGWICPCISCAFYRCDTMTKEKCKRTKRMALGSGSQGDVLAPGQGF